MSTEENIKRQHLRLEGFGVTEDNDKDTEETEEWVKTCIREVIFLQHIPLWPSLTTAGNWDLFPGES